MVSKKGNPVIGREITFLSDNLKKQVDKSNHHDTRANYILGVAVAIFIFSLTQIAGNDPGKIGFLIIAVSSLTVCVLSLFTIKPPRLKKKKRENESLFYHDKIASYSPEEYSSRLKETLKNQDLIIEQYAQEIHNLVTYHIMARKRFFRYAVLILVIGLIAGLASCVFFP